MVVVLPCFSVVRSLTSWYAFFAVIFYEACFHFLALTLHPSFFCHLHLCPDLSINFSIVFGSFWLASLFLQVSSLVTKIKDLRGNPRLPLPALLAKKFPQIRCCYWWCVLGISFVRRCPLLSRLQVCVE